MTPTRQAGLGLRVWMSLGMGLITLLFVAVAFGLLSQSSSPQASGGPPDTTPSIGEPDPGEPGPGESALAAAERLCRRDLPAVLASASRADTPADAEDLAAAADRLYRAITAVTDAAVTDADAADARWPAALLPGVTAVDQWSAGARAAPQESAYDQGRRNGIRNAQRMRAELAALGVPGCGDATQASP
jgi:hypothetical protein